MFIILLVGPKPIEEAGEEENVDLEGEEYSEETGDEDIFDEELDANFVFKCGCVCLVMVTIVSDMITNNARHILANNEDQTD